MYVTRPDEPAAPADDDIDNVGLTKREVFAAQVLANMGQWIPVPNRPQTLSTFDLTTPECMRYRADWAVQQADALIEALNAKGAGHA